MQFVLNGQSLTLDRDQVERALHHLAPEPVEQCLKSVDRPAEAADQR